jgi:hypothetical protein
MKLLFWNVGNEQNTERDREEKMYAVGYEDDLMKFIYSSQNVRLIVEKSFNLSSVNFTHHLIFYNIHVHIRIYVCV